MIETIAYLREQLAAIYDPEETRAISRWVIKHVTGYTPAQQILAKDTPIDPQQREAVRMIVRRLKLHEPIQYIVGECTFSKPFFKFYNICIFKGKFFHFSIFINFFEDNTT